MTCNTCGGVAVALLTLTWRPTPERPQHWRRMMRGQCGSCLTMALQLREHSAAAPRPGVLVEQVETSAP